jgi:tetratricopeptide (TPR) repeat protein
MNSRIWWGVAFAAALAAAPAWAHGDGEDEAVEAASGDASDADEGSATADAVFEFLVAEVAAQRGDIDGALATQFRMAKELRDANIAKRAIELAVRTRNFAAALDGGALLLEIEPDSQLAREILAALVGADNDLGKATGHVSALLKKSTYRGPLLVNLGQMFAKFPDKVAVLAATRTITNEYRDLAESHYALAVAAFLANDPKQALDEANRALEMRPSWDQGAILKAQLLRKTSPEEVLAYYEGFIAAHPQATEARMQLARELATDHRLAEARDQFREAEKLAPKDAQAPYAIGLLSLQLEDYAEAQAAFTRALKQGYKDPAAIYLGLGQAAEGMKHIDEAIGWYQKVESGDWARAQMKIATLLARQQGIEAGREYLHRIEAKTPADRVQVVQVEAQLLRDAKMWQETYDLLDKAVKEFPDSYEVRYDRAMAAERIDKLDVVEADLRKVIEMKPDYAHAYNALGYTLAEKTNRLDEARTLVEKALKLAPDDPFILDSLGWVHYRQGNMAEALKVLHQAYEARPDPEIAAHLGEALWKSGRQEEARTLWKEALSANPNHETLLSVTAKYH